MSLETPAAPAPAVTADHEILAALDRELKKLRPIFQQEGGDAIVRTVTEGVAHIAVDNGCAGCGGGVMVMAPGLRLMLLEKVPGLKEVVFE